VPAGQAADPAAQLSASQASANTPCAGQADAMATLIRRTRFVTSAPICNCFSRIVPQVACSNSVSASAIRRSAHQYVGQRSKPQPLLVGPHPRRRLSRKADRPIEEQIELAFLDAVLHVAAGAIDVLVDLPPTAHSRCGGR